MGPGEDARGRVSRARDGLRWGGERPRRTRCIAPDRPGHRHRHRHHRDPAVPDAAMGRLRAGTRQRRRPGPATRPTSSGRRPMRSWSTSCSGRRTSTSRCAASRSSTSASGATCATSGRSSSGCGSSPSSSVVVLVGGEPAARSRQRSWRAVRRGALGLTVGDRHRRGRRRWSPSMCSSSSSTAIFFPAGSYTFDPATDRLVQLFPFRSGRRRRWSSAS